MNGWTIEQVRAHAGGQWVGSRPPEAALAGAPTGVSIDSRTISPGQVFVAIGGPRFDGHDFLHAAAERGAPLLVVDRPPPPPTLGSLHDRGAAVLLVDECGAALARLGSAWRDELARAGVCVIAVCGSNGKTTTKSLINAALAPSFSGSCSEKSFNNHLGVPLTLLAARTEHAYCVCEIGTNHPGEIDALASIVRPDIAVITSIAPEHLEGLGDLAGVAAEEAAVLGHLAARPRCSTWNTDAFCALVTADSPELRPHIVAARARGTRVSTVGVSPDADIRVAGARHTRSPNGVSFEAGRPGGKEDGFVSLLGVHNAVNAALALAVADALGAEPGAARAALASVTPSPMRLQLSEVEGLTILNDAYNANPASTRAALATFLDVARDAPRRVAILGDMLELGPGAPAEHDAILRDALGERGLDLILLVGGTYAEAAHRLSTASGRLIRLDDASAAAAHLRPGDAVLLKGSRSMRLERVEQALRAGAATPV